MSDEGDRVAPHAGTALAVVDQRRVTLRDADEVLAVRAEDGEIYVGLRSVCLSLGGRAGRVGAPHPALFEEIERARVDRGHDDPG